MVKLRATFDMILPCLFILVLFSFGYDDQHRGVDRRRWGDGWGAAWVQGVNIVLQFCTWILKSGRGGNGDIWCQRTRRGNINGKERLIGREASTNFLYVSSEHVCNVL